MARVFIGTELKLNVNIEPISGLTMADYDFEVLLTANSFKRKSILIKKEQAKEEKDNSYTVCFDTAELSTGMLICRVTAYVPDDDFKDGKRTEITEINTGIEIVKLT